MDFTADEMAVHLLEARYALFDDRHRRGILPPAHDLRDEGALLALAEGGNTVGLATEEGAIVAEIEKLRLDGEATPRRA